MAVGTIDDIILEQGDTTSVEVSGYFGDPDGGTLAYTAGTSDTDVVSVSSSGSVVALRGVSAGAATVTVTAADSDGGEAEQSFGVAVTGVPVVNLAVDTASAPESGGVVLPLVLSRPPRESIFVSYALGIDDDANTLDADSADFLDGPRGTVEVLAGASEAVIEVAFRDDGDVEPTREVFVVTLDSPATGAGYQLGSRTSAAATIREGVCDRTPEVAQHIQEQVEVELCSEIADAHLEGITWLFFDGVSPGVPWPLGSGDSHDAACDTIPWFSRGYAGRRIRSGRPHPCGQAPVAFRRPPAPAGGGLMSVKPGDFAGLPGLMDLTIVRSPLADLPPGVFSDLGSLQTLLIGGTDLSRLPNGVFAGLSKLVILLLNDNQLTELPGGISDLPALEDLIVSGNQLTALPDDLFSGLEQLRVFYADHNRLTGLPADGPRSSVAQLGLYSNNLTEVPAGWFRHASEIRLLFLDDNRIRTLQPGAFSAMTHLTDLHLEKNQLSVLPDGIFDGLDNLAWFFLSDNQISSLPEGIFADQGEVTRLFLDGNELEELPREAFSRMPRLQWLALDRNRIEYLEPANFAGLRDLRQLWLSDNQLTELPDGILAGLGRLSLLALAMNQLEELPTGVLADVAALQSLYLQGNQLTSLPPAPFAGLSGLKALHLADNRLAILPGQMFAGLSNLADLSLENNPGSPFGITLDVSRTDNSNLASGPAQVSVTAASGAPFTMCVPLAVHGGELSNNSIVLRTGSVRSEEVTVTKSANRQQGTQVGVDPVPVVRYGITGIGLESGDPIVLFGEVSNLAPIAIREIPWYRLKGDTQTQMLRVSSHFRDPDGDELQYEVGNENSEVASAGLAGDRLDLTPHTAGTTIVTVTATDPGGLATTLSFPVSVRAPVPGSFDLDIVLVGTFTDEQENAFKEAADWWRSILAETELPNVPLEKPGRLGCHGVYTDDEIQGPIDDLLVVMTATTWDGPGGSLAGAAPCSVREGSLLPFLGIVYFDQDDLQRLDQSIDLVEVILHEIGHVLGIGSIWRNLGLLMNPSLNDPGTDTHFAGRLAHAAFDDAGGTDYGGRKVPVQNSGGAAAADSHWRQSVLLTELMTPYLSLAVPDPLSAITIQSLADLGYTVAVNLAEPYTLPAWAAGDHRHSELLFLGGDVLPGSITVVGQDGRTVGVIER